jgi:MFS family permease
LYAAQGIPFGFATLYIPLQIAQRADFSYGKSTLFTLASFPWLLKLLWAPAADTIYSHRLGRRRSWILPAQLLLAVTALGAMGLNFQGALWPLFVLTALFNLWASVQDTAVDGLAVEMLNEQERGLGNAVQVGGYKIGMVAGGSGLVAVSEKFGTQGAMIALAAGVGALLLVPLFYREPPPTLRAERAKEAGAGALSVLWQLLRGNGWVSTLVFIATVKIGETMVSNLLKPFLVREAHFTPMRASYVIGVLSLVSSLLGSAIGGYVSGRIGRLRALVIFGIVQAIVLCVLGIGIKLQTADQTLVALIVVEHFAAGLLTPALFAYMMDITEPSIAATHYTLLATVELIMKGAGGALAGPLADAMGVSTFIVVAGTLGALPLLLLPKLRRPIIRQGTAAELSAADLPEYRPHPS